jgi:hypothetical protein
MSGDIPPPSHVLSLRVYEWLHLYFSLFFLWLCSPARAMTSSSTRFHDHTQRRVTLCRTPLDECLARRRDLYLTTHNKHNRQTSFPPVVFEPTIAVGEWPLTYALDRAVTWTLHSKICSCSVEDKRARQKQSQLTFCVINIHGLRNGMEKQNTGNRTAASISKI